MEGAVEQVANSKPDSAVPVNSKSGSDKSSETQQKDKNQAEK